jgi:transposase InsO family protein
MDIHKNARTTPHSRMLIVQRLAEGWSVTAAAVAQGVAPKTVRKWRDRHAADGAAGLADRPSRPHRSPMRLAGRVEDEIERLRRQRLSGPAIARRLQRPVSTVGVALRRRGLGRLSALDPRPPIVRYEREKPGELIHIDIKKLGRIDGIGHRITGDRTGQSNRRAAGRGLGWEFVHVAVDDASRLAYTELLPDERKESAVAFTARAIGWFAHHGVTVERVMSDNGSAYKSFAFRDLLAERGIKHKRTRPYTPRTNGKAERFIQTSLREWAYAQPFQTSAERAAAMLPWITEYNRNRPHSALGGKPPLTRLALSTTQAVTKIAATSDPKPRFVGVAGVKPREATAKGGSGLTPDTPTQAKSAIGWDNVLGNDT